VYILLEPTYIWSKLTTAHKKYVHFTSFNLSPLPKNTVSMASNYPFKPGFKANMNFLEIYVSDVTTEMSSGILVK
jgi:hypothetical protein